MRRALRLARRAGWACVLTATAVEAQQVAVEPAPLPTALPGWMVAWSPLRPLADRTGDSFRAPRPAGLLVDPAPRVGGFWTAGNPAGLLLEEGDGWTGFRGGYADGGEGLRRPLDPEAPAVARFLGIAWRPVSEGASVAGLVDVANEWDGPRSEAMGLRPYGSNPFVPVDTLIPEASILRVRLEGASGYELGAWSFGLAAGYEAMDSGTENTVFPRSGRATATGLSGGIGWRPWGGETWFGLDARWRGASENASEVDPGRRIVAAVLHGFVDPEPIGPVNQFSRRFDSNAWSVGLAAEGRWAAFRWTAFARKVDNEETQTSSLQDSGREDRWRADGFAAGLGVAGLLGGLELSAQATWDDRSGAAERHDLTGAIVRSDESELAFRGDVRSTGEGAWGWGGALELGRERRELRDLILRQTATGVDWRFGGSLEVRRRIFDRLEASLSYGLLARRPDLVRPDSLPDGVVISEIVEPTLTLYGLDGLAQAGSLTVAWQATGGAAVWTRATFASAGVDADGESSPLFETRSAFAVDVGVTLRE